MQFANPRLLIALFQRYSYLYAFDTFFFQTTFQEDFTHLYFHWQGLRHILIDNNH